MTADEAGDLERVSELEIRPADARIVGSDDVDSAARPLREMNLIALQNGHIWAKNYRRSLRR